MVAIRLRKDNPSGKKSTIMHGFNSDVVVDTENWAEIDDIDASTLNPNVFEFDTVKGLPKAVIKVEEIKVVEQPKKKKYK